MALVETVDEQVEDRHRRDRAGDDRRALASEPPGRAHAAPDAGREEHRDEETATDTQVDERPEIGVVHRGVEHEAALVPGVEIPESAHPEPEHGVLPELLNGAGVEREAALDAEESPEVVPEERGGAPARLAEEEHGRAGARRHQHECAAARRDPRVAGADEGVEPDPREGAHRAAARPGQHEGRRDDEPAHAARGGREPGVGDGDEQPDREEAAVDVRVPRHGGAEAVVHDERGRDAFHPGRKPDQAERGARKRARREGAEHPHLGGAWNAARGREREHREIEQSAELADRVAGQRTLAGGEERRAQREHWDRHDDEPEAGGKATGGSGDRTEEDERRDGVGGREAERRAIGHGEDRLQRDQQGVEADRGDRPCTRGAGHHTAPRRRSTAGSVRRRIWTSSCTERSATYWRSMRARSG